MSFGICDLRRDCTFTESTCDCADFLGKAEPGAGRQYFMSLNEKLISFFPSSPPPVTVISATAWRVLTVTEQLLLSEGLLLLG